MARTASCFARCLAALLVTVTVLLSPKLAAEEPPVIRIDPVELPEQVEPDPASTAEQHATGKEDSGAFPAHIEALLTEPDPDGVAEKGTRCVSLNRIRDLRVVDDTHVAFRTKRDLYQLAVLRNRCVGLDRGGTVGFQSRGGRLCVGDSIQPIDRFGGRSFGIGCSIDRFVSVSGEHLAMLEAQLNGQ